MSGRIMAVDPGEKRIGLAISDPTGMLARPLRVIAHISRTVDAAMIAAEAVEQGAVRIIVGQAMDDEGLPSPEGRKAARLAGAIKSQTALPIELWDESFSTQTARETRFIMGVNRKKRSGHMDDAAAAVILQSYLDAHSQPPSETGSI